MSFESLGDFRYAGTLRSAYRLIVASEGPERVDASGSFQSAARLTEKARVSRCPFEEISERS